MDNCCYCIPTSGGYASYCPRRIVLQVYDSAGLKETHYTNGDVDYRDINGFIEGLEGLVELGSLQAELDAWDALSDEALAEFEGAREMLKSWVESMKAYQRLRKALHMIAAYDTKDTDPLYRNAVRQWANEALLPEERIFSGLYSQDMWEEINSAKTRADLRRALCFVCCRIQELESKLSK